jgi:hypothetical protein
MNGQRYSNCLKATVYGCCVNRACAVSVASGPEPDFAQRPHRRSLDRRLRRLRCTDSRRSGIVLTARVFPTRPHLGGGSFYC